MIEVEKNFYSSIKNLIKNLHTKNEANRMIGVVVITPITLKNRVASKNTSNDLK